MRAGEKKLGRKEDLYQILSKQWGIAYHVIIEKVEQKMIRFGGR